MMARDPLAGGMTDLPVLLPTPSRLRWTGPAAMRLPAGVPLTMLAVVAALFCVSTLAAEAAVAATETSVLLALLKWTPIVFKGFLFNLLVSVLAMSIGTAGGVVLGLAQISLAAPIRKLAWGATQFFRNAPWLVLLFYAMLLIPFELRLFGAVVPFPAWIKAVIGLALPVAANVSEIVRGGVLSIPLAQWESAESLAFTRRQTLWRIILPQALKRMIPPWMNLYAVLTMASSLISIVGVDDSLSYARSALNAEGRPDLLLPMYTMLLLFFFMYCYPIARWTQSLERRFAVKAA